MEPFAITVEEAAELAHTGYKQITEWAENDKTFPAFKIGNRTIIPVDSFREWINQRGRLRVDMPEPESSIARRIKADRKRHLRNRKGETS